MPYNSQADSYPPSSCTPAASTHSTPVALEQNGNFVLHQPQLDALKALSQWTDDFDKFSLHTHEGDEDNNQDADCDEAEAETTTDFSDASTAPGLLCMPCGMGKT
eukprot:1589777-Pleurochrysis_carterae.AAC.1